MIFGVWNYLQRATMAEILALPEVGHRCRRAVAAHLPRGALVDWIWLNHGIAVPAKSNSAWARKIKRQGQRRELRGERLVSKPEDRAEWQRTSGHGIRTRIAHNVTQIKHWTIIHGSWEDAPNIRNAHWHVDPPYQGTAGRAYRYNEVNYTAPAQWCRERAEAL